MKEWNEKILTYLKLKERNNKKRQRHGERTSKKVDKRIVNKRKIDSLEKNQSYLRDIEEKWSLKWLN